MPTTGILRPAEVVFYHPLDDFVESAVGQTWTGSGGFTAGKIGSANSAVAADAVSWGSANDTFALTSNRGHIAAISPTKVIVSANVFESSAWSVRARVGTISGTDITWGTEVTVNVGNNGNRVAVLSTSTVVFAYTADARVGTISGTDITLGPETAWDTNSGLLGLAKIDATHCLLTWTDANFGPFHGSSRVGTVSGTDITFGTKVAFTEDGGGRSVVEFIDSTTFLIVYAEGSFSAENKLRAKIGTVSGTDITYGVEFVVTGTDLEDGMFDSAMLSTTSFIVAYRQDITNDCLVRVGTISGADITVGPAAFANGICGGNTDDSQIAVTKLTSTSAVVAYSDSVSNGPVRSKIATVSGTDVTFGSESTTDAINATYVHGARLSDSSIVIDRGGSSVAVFVGTIDFLAGITAPTPAAYPAATGNDRLVLAMWANKLGAGISTITAQRDFTVAFTATTIDLGPATATWSDGAIGTLMSTMAAGEHFLVLDFEHTGAGSWTLKTSLDGAAFASQGVQDSGTRTTSPAALTPGLSIVDPSDGQWVDELVLWAGDKSSFESFEAQELANLFDLADTFDEPMNQYEENFGAPICWQATAKMPDGTVWRDSGSGPCPPVVRVPRGAEDVVVTDDGRRAHPRVVEG